MLESDSPDCVLHLAAESHVNRSIDGSSQFIQTYIVGTYQLLQASLGYNRELEFVSEAAVSIPAYLDRRGVWIFGNRRLL